MLNLHRLGQQIADEPRAVFSLSLWFSLLLIDTIMWSRRLAGAMSIPLSAAWVWSSSLIVAVIAVGALACWRDRDGHNLPRTGWWPEFLTLAAALLWGVAVGIGTTPLTWGGLVALGGLLGVSVGLTNRWLPGVAEEILGCELASAGKAGMGTQTAECDVAESVPVPTHQQKRLTIDGVELIEGEAVVEFLPGQKEALLHLSFCPPLAVVPEVHGEDADGGELEIRAEAVHTFGARLSIRRTAGTAAAESRQISYVASPPAVNDAAA